MKEESDDSGLHIDLKGGVIDNSDGHDINDGTKQRKQHQCTILNLEHPKTGCLKVKGHAVKKKQNYSSEVMVNIQLAKQLNMIRCAERNRERDENPIGH